MGNPVDPNFTVPDSVNSPEALVPVIGQRLAGSRLASRVGLQWAVQDSWHRSHSEANRVYLRQD